MNENYDYLREDDLPHNPLPSIRQLETLSLALIRRHMNQVTSKSEQDLLTVWDAIQAHHAQFLPPPPEKPSFDFRRN